MTKTKDRIGSQSLFKQILIFSLPIMAMNALQLLFNAADMIVVGRFSGKEALAAVGATGALINLLINTFMGLSVGTSVVVAQAYGAKDNEGVSRATHTSLVMSLIGGVFVAILGLIFCTPILKLTGTPDDIIELSVLYMKLYFIGVPANMVYNFAAAVLRAIGDSQHPMYYLVISGVANIIMNVFFVVAFHMSVAGVALATIISQYLSAWLILRRLRKNTDSTALDYKKLKIDRDKLRQIIRIGIPAGLQQAFFSISNVLIQSAINSFGSTLIAANSASGNVEGFMMTTMNAYYNAAITFTGQSMGAKQYDDIDRVAKICTWLIVGTWIILGLLILTFGGFLLGIYTNDKEVIELGMLRMRVVIFAYAACGVMNVFPGLTRGMGFSVLPMLCTLIGACALRIVWLVTVFPLYHTVVGLFLCYPVTWTAAGIGQVLSFFYARRKIRANA